VSEVGYAVIQTDGRGGAMYCPYFLLASRYSRGRTRGIAKDISEINFKINNRILIAGYTTGDLNL
jgi:hypothetical protein